MRILSIGAHPDDTELTAAGTLAKYVEQGHEVVMCISCNGSQGHFEIPSAHLQCIRRREARQSAEVIGAECILLDLPDSGPWHTQEQRSLYTELVREVKPDVILTHYPVDYMSDHVETSRNTLEASFWAAVPLYLTGGQSTAHTHYPAVYYWEPLGGHNFQPYYYVDVTDQWEKKREMLLCHQSQYVWLRDHDGIDYVDFMAVTSHFRGLQCGVKYAEAFRPLQLWARTRAGRLLP
jgi:LmbE family N-acetylglucosaminyl deacetylase